MRVYGIMLRAEIILVHMLKKKKKLNGAVTGDWERDCHGVCTACVFCCFVIENKLQNLDSGVPVFLHDICLIYKEILCSSLTNFLCFNLMSGGADRRETPLTMERLTMQKPDATDSDHKDSGTRSVTV